MIKMTIYLGVSGVSKEKIIENVRGFHEKLSKSDKSEGKMKSFCKVLIMLTLHVHCHVLSKHKSYQCYFLLYC